MALNLPPLLGDGKGHYRIHLVGNSGVGKTTTGNALAAILGIPFISLDTIFWRPGWQQCPRDEFIAEIRAAMDADPKGWIIDGNYTKRGTGFVTDEATDVIWFDPPLMLYFPRLLWRTFCRLAGAPTCAPGCPETFREVFFSKKSIILWCLSNHGRTRRTQKAALKRMDIVNGTSTGQRKMRRLGGWGNDVRNWVDSVQQMVATAHKDD